MSRALTKTRPGKPTTHVATDAGPLTLGLDQFLVRLFGPAPPGFLIACDIGGRWDVHVIEAAFIHQLGRWRQLGQWKHDQAPDVATWMHRQGPCGVYLAMREQPDYVGALQPLRHLWVTLPVPVGARLPNEPLPRRDDAAAKAARERLATLPVRPSIMVDEGTSFTALWTLTEPLGNMEHAKNLLWKLAGRLNGDRATQIDPRQARVLLPGTRADKVWLHNAVTVEAWSAAPVELALLERYALQEPIPAGGAR